MVQIFGGIGEWIIGNTFSCALFFTYGTHVHIKSKAWQNTYTFVTGTFWIVQGTTLMPFFATGIHFSSTGNFLEGQQTPMYNASIGLLNKWQVALALAMVDRFNSILFCGPDSHNLHIHDMLPSYQRLPLLRALLA